MSFLAIQGIPGNWTLTGTVKVLAKLINGNFTALNFAPNMKNKKTLYIQLSKYVDPFQAIERINKEPVKRLYLKAYIPTNVPKAILNSKPKQLPFQVRKSLRIRDELNLEVVLEHAHTELLQELQSKYTGLYNLSRKFEHKLMENISETILSRLFETADANPESIDNGFLLTKAYRKQYPHYDDFQLITSINKKLGGGEIHEPKFRTVSTHPYAIDNVPFDKIQSICNKYSEKITKEVTAHLQSLPVEPDLNADTENDIARKKVRVELKKIIPYLPTMIRQVIAQNFIPEKSPYHKIRMYGEPFLPPKESMSQLLKRHRAVKITRSDRLYNLLKFNIPPQDYGSLIAMDGTVIGGATLVIRSSDIPLYSIPKSISEKILAHCGVQNDGQLIRNNQSNDDDYIDEDFGDENDEDNAFVDDVITGVGDQEENWSEIDY